MQLDRATMLEAYRRMVKIRAFEERVGADSMSGLIPGFVHLYAGEEAAAVGVCLNLTDDDWIGSTHRGHGHCIAKGCGVEEMMLEIHGKQGGLCGGKGGSMHIADLDKGMLGANGIVGGSPPLAVGAALSAKVRRTGAVAVAFFGDGASNQGTTAEALNMAVVLQVPVLFVLENNGYGEFTAASYHSAGVDLAQRAAGFGLTAVKVDGNDFFAVHDAARTLIERARQESLPAFLEIDVKRWHGHFTGDQQPYRSAEELAAVRLFDPISSFRSRVVDAGLLDADALTAIDREIDELIERSAEIAMAAPLPPVAAVTQDVYVSY
ncbi:thiamine pyrophosphate-dependent dehydrogenase E1 component subunit alpha [Sphingobium sp. TB-6]|nr:thiamine pyrophosphate-dependent dehydrogenase E1 component subunit alpha [Sphingobium sp. TB-6]